MNQISVFVCGLAMITMVGCATGSGKHVIDPFTPEEVEVLVYAATATYLMDKPLTPNAAQAAAIYVASLQAVVQSETLDTVALRKELVTNVPAQWRPLAEATWVILVKRIHLDGLIEAGQYPEARAYIGAALNGTIRGLGGAAR